MKVERRKCLQTGQLEPLSLYEARKAMYADKRVPTEADAPPVKPFPGKRIVPTPGQLDVFGGVVE